jgi:uncharacterized protein YrzB (UPF0473 family)
MGNTNNEEYMEFETFMITMSDGKEQECAIVDEFDFEGKHYILAAEIHDDQVSDGAYLCRGRNEADGFVVERIETKSEYERAAKAYMELRS